MVAAMSDGSLVANLLVHLRQASPPDEEEVSQSPLLTWLVRQRRSRPMLQSSSKPTPTGRPTTPLSWSGGGDAASRSKVIDGSEKASSKSSRKKKSLAELKEDEVLVLKERKDLEKKLVSLHVIVEIERATSDRWKRLKLDYGSGSAKIVALPSADLRISDSEQSRFSIAPKPNEELMNWEDKFMLPDLNLPVEDHTARDLRLSPRWIK